MKVIKKTKAKNTEDLIQKRKEGRERGISYQKRHI